MGRKLDQITFYRPGFKLVMARKEVRRDNGDMEVPPRIFRRVVGGWEQLDWRNLPDNSTVLNLVELMKGRRLDHWPVWRNALSLDERCGHCGHHIHG